MSVKNFKVGDKVKVREGLISGRYYDGVYCTRGMANSDEVFTVRFVGKNVYKLEGHDLWWVDEMLEPAEKTLDNLCAGDFVRSGDSTRKVLAVVDGCYLLSNIADYTTAGYWFTSHDLKDLNYVFVGSDTPEPTIEIYDKKYKKADVEKAIKDLEVVE